MANNADYGKAFQLGREVLMDQDPALLARLGGGRIERDASGKLTLSLLLLNKIVGMTWPECTWFEKDSGHPLPFQENVFLAHYLIGAFRSGGLSITGQWINFRDLPDGRFYQAAFEKRVKTPLVRSFGTRPERLRDLSTGIYNAKPIEMGDCGVAFMALPLVPVALILWKGDDEFPADGNILFDRNSVKLFPAEDMAWLAGRVVYPLLKVF